MTTENCYVCRELVDCEDLDAIHVATKYTKTPISELILGLLDANEPRQFGTNDSLCSRCLHKFNQYDLARLTVQRVEAELKRTLLLSHHFLKQEVTDYSDLDRVDNAEEEIASIADFRKDHHECDSKMVREESAPAFKHKNSQESAQIEYLEINELLVYEESGEDLLEAEIAPQRARTEINRPDKAVPDSPLRQPPDPKDTKWQERHKLKAWLETIDGNEKEVYCKICEQEVVASKTFLIAHGQSRAHVRKMSNQAPKNAASHESLPPTTSASQSQKIKVPQSGTLFRQSSGQIVFRCDVCYHEELNSRDLRCHIESHDNKFKCVVCARVLKTREYLLHHMRIHVDARQNREDEMVAAQTSKFKCTICNEDTFSEYALSQHVKTHRTLVGTLSQLGTDQVVLRCDFCYHEEQNDSDLIAHLALHGGKLKCVICAKEPKGRIELRSHMRCHSDKKYYQCDKCGKEFTQNSSLRTHLATTHTVERKAQCELCPMSFKRKSGLSRHMLIHTGERSHACPECGKCFAVPGNMRAHYKLHLGISSRSKRHICIICNTTFDKPSQLEQHCIKIHSRATTEEADA